MSAEVLEEPSGVMASSRSIAAMQAGDAEISPRDGDRLEVRYFDEPERFRRWMIPMSYVVDLVNWWNMTGRAHRHTGQATSETCFGCVNVVILSPNQIYFRGRSPLGRPNVTGFQLPRQAVEALCTYCASQSADSDIPVLARSELHRRRHESPVNV